ncbi:hypothetical protein AZE42_11951 [Rhizopogon vesiculosus]|uniref:DUF4470 domain-containing protein n=1 Tax=Rhizopogon vesiculosus TaxID=180088 RepID=A0A1J8QEP5_9AGAM|nr:hypothetical protein AZE42_11951 [Rhizopogon vesiculosus]
MPRLLTSRDPVAALSASMYDTSATSSLRTIPPDPSTSSNFADFDVSDPKCALEACRKMKPKFPPPEMLPCANVEVVKYKVCPKQGTKTCMQHALSLTAWLSGVPAQSLAYSQTRWGNVPAIDLINLPKNENDASQDLSIALIASGDLRHVVQTINSLPDYYSGHLEVLINDVSLPVVARNIAILLILGTASDETLAADIALHFWYSVFIPLEYAGNILAIVTSFLFRETEEPQPLGPRSSMNCLIPEEAMKFFLRFGSTASISMADAQNEYDRVRTASSRGDFRDRMYAGLKPSHRVAFQEFRRFGIVLPFGAVNTHFNIPNASLFSLDGKWWQVDHADPLQGWDIGPILDAGRAHGAQPEDIYGCLYFFLSDQLRTFARRLREFRISFRVVTTEASHLSSIIRKDILSPFGIPASVRFDRIDVSNILDDNYVGIEDVLTHWGPLLKDRRTATLVGYFMNWGFFQPNGDAKFAGSIEHDKLVDAFIEKGRFPGIGPGGRISNPQDLQTGLFLVANDINVAYDNSKAFSQFLKQHNLENLLRKTKLKLRTTRTIVPHRYRVPLDAAPNAVPEFADNESWYNYTQLQSFTWMERFVEFGRA